MREDGRQFGLEHEAARRHAGAVPASVVHVVGGDVRNLVRLGDVADAYVVDNEAVEVPLVGPTIGGGNV
jgi:hypothetical protein